MKEIIVKIPDESSEFVTLLLEKLGAEITHKKTIQKTSVKKEEAKNKTKISKKKKLPQKIDHTFLFGKWKDLDIDPKKLRQESW